MTEYGSPSTTERVWWGAVVNSNEPLRYSLDYKEIYDISETGRSRLLQLNYEHASRRASLRITRVVWRSGRRFMAILLAQKVKSQKIPKKTTKTQKTSLGSATHGRPQCFVGKRRGHCRGLFRQLRTGRDH